MFEIYWLISQDYRKTYVGYTDNLKERIQKHKKGHVRSTKNFGNFRFCRIEKVSSKTEAIKRERYWKSAAGKKRLKKLYNQIISFK